MDSLQRDQLLRLRAIVCANVRERPLHRSRVSASPWFPEPRPLCLAHVVEPGPADGLDRNLRQARWHSSGVSRHRSSRRPDRGQRARAICIYRHALWRPAEMADVPEMRSPLPQALRGAVFPLAAVSRPGARLDTGASLSARNRSRRTAAKASWRWRLELRL